MFHRSKKKLKHPAKPRKSRRPLFLGDFSGTLILLVPVTFLGIVFFFGITLLFGYAPQDRLSELFEAQKLEVSEKALGIAVALAGAFAATLVARAAHRAQISAGESAREMGENAAKRNYFETARKDLEIHRELQGRIEDIFQISDDFVDFAVRDILAEFNDDEKLDEASKHQSVHDRSSAFRAAQRSLWGTIDRAEATVTPGISLRSLWDGKFSRTSSILGDSGERSLTVHVARIFGLYKYRTLDECFNSSNFTSLTARLRASVHDEQAYQDVQVLAEEKIKEVLKLKFEALKVGLKSEYEGLKRTQQGIERELKQIIETLGAIPKAAELELKGLESTLEEMDSLAAKNI